MFSIYQTSEYPFSHAFWFAKQNYMMSVINLYSTNSIVSKCALQLACMRLHEPKALKWTHVRVITRPSRVWTDKINVFLAEF